jgi:hypothetical protein
MKSTYQFACTVAAAALAAAAVFASPAMAAKPSLAVLGTHLQNDNEMYEPTTAAERARLAMVEKALRKQLESSGRFTLKPVPADVVADIAAGQELGACGGCELDYGSKLGVDRVAWINVQKVSNLILNLNVYVADVKAKKMTFVRSVDIRGNTDESWTRSLTYLVKNYLLPQSEALPSG